MQTIRERWAWDDGLADTFDEHAAASIPLYAEQRALTLELSDWFASPGGTVYDLGSSTGTLAAALAERHPQSRVVGVDSEQEITHRARQLGSAAEFITADVGAMNLDRAGLIIAHHLTPFLSADDRRALLHRIHAALQPAGALILFEKTEPVDAAAAALCHSILAAYKLASGLSAAEVLAKDFSLRGVMDLWPAARTADELQSAGFSTVTSIFRWMNWDGYLAVRGAR